jgi:hypothetical protein
VAEFILAQKVNIPSMLESEIRRVHKSKGASAADLNRIRHVFEDVRPQVLDMVRFFSLDF